MVDPTADVMVPDPSFMDDYDTGGDYTPPPQPKVIEGGRTKYVKFTATAPDLPGIQLKDANGKWLKTREGWLKAVVKDIKLTESGYVIQQTHFSTAQYNKFKDGQKTGEKRNASPAVDYLRGHGDKASGLVQPEDYQVHFEATANRNFEVTIDWNAFDNETQQDVARKWEEFPDDPANPGKKLPYIERNGKRFWARASIKRVVDAVQD